MKNYFFKYTFLKLIIALLFLGVRTVAQEFDANNYKMAFSLKTDKNYDNSRLLEVSFIAKNKKNRRDKIPKGKVEKENNHSNKEMAPLHIRIIKNRKVR